MKTKYTIKEIKEQLAQVTEENDFLTEIRQDERSGVQAALRQWEKKQQKKAELMNDFSERLAFEHAAKQKGYRLIAGVDEVGRGPLAGPVVTAAVIIPEDFTFYEVNDSKKLSAAKREELFDKINEHAIAIGIGIMDEAVIDQVNIYQATKLAMIQAIEKLEVQPDYLLLDAMELDVPIAQESLIKGDARSVSIACASIIAKVTRDRLMADYDRQFPGYDFANNAGYGTKNHLDGLDKHGVCPIHRKTFAPIKNML